MSKRAIGIITLPGNFNYGNRLQCYAMTKAVSSVGCEPYALEREKSFPLYRSVYYWLKRKIRAIMQGSSCDSPEKMSSPQRIAAFKRFGGRIPTRVLPGYGYSPCDEFSFYIVGSDQVWNPNGIAHQEKWYFAKFAKPNQRIAVAASIGIDDFSSKKQMNLIAQGLKGFSRVSLREKRGAELIKQITGRDIEVICDPTLTLSADEWREVADDAITPKVPYVFTYLLGGIGADAAEVLEIVTKHGTIPVVPLSDRQKPGEPDAGPAEFISLIDNATHVVTDSFHAAVFSSILHTPLTIVHREGGASMFSRLEMLSQTLGIEEKIYGSTTYDISKAGDYDGVDVAIAHERERFMGFLEGCLDVDSSGLEGPSHG